MCSLATLLIATLAVSAPGNADSIDELIESVLQQQGIPGMSILVTRGDNVVKHASYGKANLELDVPTKPDMMYKSGSIGKTFTALAAMSLVEDGKIALNDSLSQHIEGLPNTWSKVKVENLLTHTSGIPEYALIEELGLVEEYDRKLWWETVSKLPLDFPTDTQFSYSNSNYFLLAELIAKTSGKSFYDAVNERVIKKAGLAKTFYYQTNQIVPNRATGYLKTRQGMIVTPASTRSAAYGAGGLMTNVEDLTKLLRACNEGEIVSKKTLRQMQTRYRTSDRRKITYGYGWFIRDLGGHPVYSHGGNTAGYSAGMSYFPDQDLTVVVMGNVYPFSGDNIATRIARLLHPELNSKKMVERPDPDPAFANVLKGSFKALSEQKTDHESFDDAYKARLLTSRGQRSLGSFAQFKEYDSFTFLEKANDDPDTRYTYRMKKGGASFRVIFTVTTDKKVFAVSLQRETS